MPGSDIIGETVMLIDEGRYTQVNFEPVIRHIAREIAYSFGCVADMFKAKRGFKSMIVCCRDFDVIVWFRASPIRRDRADAVAKVFGLSALAGAKPLIVLCLHPSDVPMTHLIPLRTKLLNKNIHIVLYPLNKDTLKALLKHVYGVVNEKEAMLAAKTTQEIIEFIKEYVGRTKPSM